MRGIGVILCLALCLGPLAYTTAAVANQANVPDGVAHAPRRDASASHLKTRATIDEVLKRREFADLNTDPYAAQRSILKWISDLLHAIVRPLKNLPAWLLWVIVGWMVLALLAILAHLLYTLWMVSGGASLRRFGGKGARQRLQGELLGIRELDFDVVYAEARRLLAEGNWPAATKYLYVAAILWLDRQGCIVFRSSKTNSDYLHELHQRQRCQTEFRRLTVCFESIVYGGRSATGESSQEMAHTIEDLLHEPSVAVAN